MPEQELVTPIHHASNQSDTPRFNYQSIGEGPLALKTKAQNFSFLNLKEEIIFLRRNTRPDAPLHNLDLHIGLRGGDGTILATLGQKFFLSYVQNRLSPTQESESPLWIRPYLNEQEEPHLEVGLDLIPPEPKVPPVDRVSTLRIEPPQEGDTIYRGDPTLSQGIQGMKRARWWAPDRLFEVYGGKVFGQFVGVERLEFNGRDSSYFLYVKEGDTLIWDGIRWQKSDDTTPYPMAKLLHISPHSMRWKIWDRMGLEWVEVTHTKEKSVGSFLHAESSFTQVRKRSASLISCQVDDRKMILKKGDWLLLTSTGWRLLKTPREVERVVHFELKGELCVFDGVEQVGGESMFCGTLFDTMRVQMHRMKIPCSRARASRERGGRGNPSSKKRGAPIGDRLSPPHGQLSPLHTPEEHTRQTTAEN